MANKYAEELRKKSLAELQKELKAQLEALRKYRFAAIRKELKDVKLIQKTRKQIARIKTILKEKLEEKEEKNA